MSSSDVNVNNNKPSAKMPETKIRVSNVGDKVMRRGEGDKWQSLMKKLAFESRGLKKKMKNRRLSKSARSTSSGTSTTSTSNRSLLEKIPQLPKSEIDELVPLLQAFTTRHQSHHRPIALVTSGGTATDLEVHAVRYLDNFSTGLRGAISVEEFLKRGYAVIHLWREGSAAPYSRLLSQLLGSKQGNHALAFDALGTLFAGQGDDIEGKNDDDGTADHNHDPWLTSTEPNKKSIKSTRARSKSNDGDGVEGDYDYDPTATSNMGINLSKTIMNSTILQTKLRERADVAKGGMLLTVPFRTVEQYLAKLQLCTEAINDCQSLGLVYLTAAVSDFYIPKDQKSEHKIQSRNYGIKGNESEHETEHKRKEPVAESTIRMDPNTNCLHLKLSPVPKILTLVREDFAPNAFCVSFKLETDKNILVEKARIAIQKYDMHMVIGNVLETRYDKVWILQNRGIYISGDDDDDENENDDGNGNDTPGSKLAVTEVSRNDAPSSSIDGLEDAMISHVIEKHFEYIANHYLVDENGNDNESNGVLPRTALMAGAEAAARHNEYLKEKKRQLQNELYWRRVRDNTLTMAGHAMGMYLTFVASSALQRRMR